MVASNIHDPDFPWVMPTSALEGILLKGSESDQVDKIFLEVVADPRARDLMEDFESCCDGGRPDAFTIEHSLTTCWVAGAICHVRGLDPDYVIAGMQAGLLHDVAKQGEAFQRIIHIRRRWSKDERSGIRSHPEIGARLVAEAGLPGIVSMAVLTHHGFQHDPYGGDPQEVFGPFELGDKQLSPELEVAAAVACADTYSAARTERPDRPGSRLYLPWYG